jgi:3,4-dihydroxy 2-butanone 4-phosphate synthase/GTP cyclohydrolase II
VFYLDYAYMSKRDQSKESLLLVKAKLPTEFGNFMAMAIKNEKFEEMPHIILVHEKIDVSKTVPVRIHSECLTGDVFGSKRCDCGQQLHHSMEILGRQKGVLIYLRQEGRGIGLTNKLKAYNLQDQGIDTFDANTHLGFDPDERDYSLCVEILSMLSITNINLITNNPDKVQVFDNTSIFVVDRTPIIIPPTEENRSYLSTKRIKMGHLL